MSNRSILRIVGVIAGVAVCLSCASGHVEEYDRSLPVLRPIRSLVERVTGAAAISDALSVSLQDTVVHQGTGYPIPILRYRPRDAEGVRRILVLAGIHGNEPAGAEWALTLAEALARASSDGSALIDLAPDVMRSEIDIVPVINPWGWAHDRRHTAEGIDINRDFATFASQEAKIIRRLVEENEYDAVIDHHEDGAAEGFYLYQYGKRDEALSRTVIAAVGAMGYPPEQNINMIILKTRDGLINAPMWGLRYMRLTRQLSMTNYIRLSGIVEVYTVETPKHLPLEERVALHRTAFAGLTSYAVECELQRP